MTVNGTSGSLLGLYTGGTTSKGYLYSNGSQLYLVSDSTGGPLQLQVSSANPMLFFVNGSERARIPATGQLLVGATSTPAGSASILAVNSAAGGGIELANNNNGGGNIAGLSGGGLSFSTFTGALGGEVYTPRMLIDVNGNVGIGTSSASSNLSVQGTATFTGLVNLKTYVENASSPTISSGTLTIDLSNTSVFTVSLNANITTLNIINTPVTAGLVSSFTIIFTATGTAYSVAWPASVRWPGAVAPTITSTNTKRDVDRKSTRLDSSHSQQSRMPSSA